MNMRKKTNRESKTIILGISGLDQELDRFHLYYR